MGMSRKEFADFVGVTPRTITAWELEQRTPKKTTLLWIKELEKNNK